MNATKPWYLSRTIWASLITIATSVLAMTGVPIDGIDNGQLADNLLQGITAIAGVVAVLGRLGAVTRIG